VKAQVRDARGDVTEDHMAETRVRRLCEALQDPRRLRDDEARARDRFSELRVRRGERPLVVSAPQLRPPPFCANKGRELLNVVGHRGPVKMKSARQAAELEGELARERRDGLGHRRSELSESLRLVLKGFAERGDLRQGIRRFKVSEDVEAIDGGRCHGRTPPAARAA
jgi:hypothetical protein